MKITAYQTEINGNFFGFEGETFQDYLSYLETDEEDDRIESLKAEYEHIINHCRAKVEINPQEGAEVIISEIRHCGILKRNVVKKFKFSPDMDDIHIDLSEEFDNLEVEYELLDEEGEQYDAETVRTLMSY